MAEATTKDKTSTTAKNAVETKPPTTAVETKVVIAAIDTKPAVTAVDTKSAVTAVDTKPAVTAVDTKPAVTAADTKPTATAVETKPIAAENDFVIALLQDGEIRRFSKREEAPAGSLIFGSMADLMKLSIEEMDKITGMILKAPIPASKTLEAGADRAWTAMLAASLAPPAKMEPKKAKSMKVGNGTFKLTYDFDAPGSAEEKFNNLPPQAQVCLKIMARGGKASYSEAELRKLVEDHSKDLNTVQEPWRIFQYYRHRLADDKLIQAA